jgi:3,4-dihydroxy 2-butanone 4-phosphate synthase
MGHTELCVYLARLADITQAIVMCEMMDSETHRALSVEDAKAYGRKHGIPLVDAEELKAHARVA